MFQIIYFIYICFFIPRFTHILVFYAKFSENLKHSVKYQIFSECEFSNLGIQYPLIPDLCIDVN